MINYNLAREINFLTPTYEMINKKTTKGVSESFSPDGMALYKKTLENFSITPNTKGTSLELAASSEQHQINREIKSTLNKPSIEKVTIPQIKAHHLFN